MRYCVTFGHAHGSLLPNSSDAGVRSLYEKLGLLPCASLLFSALAAVLQRVTPLPKQYTWFEPLRTLRTVAQLGGFPCALVIVYAFGVLARDGWSGSLARARAWRRPGGARVAWALLVALLLFVIDGLVLQARREPSDIAAILVMAVIVSGFRTHRAELLHQLGYVVVATAVFMAICYFFTVLKALTFMTGRSFDAQIIAIESAVFGVAPHRVIAQWIATRPSLLAWCDWVYFRFFHHMALTAVLLVAMRKPRERTEYLGALALCYVLAGPLYHVWPAAGPSFFEPQYFRYLSDPSLMAHDIHLWLAENTDNVLSGRATLLQTWGYIACMPSLHVAQEFVMLYYARHSLPAFLLSLAFTLVTLLAVVALGWHYPIDSLAGALLASLAIWLAHRWRRTLLPAALCAAEDLVPAAAPWFRRFTRGTAPVTPEGAGHP